MLVTGTLGAGTMGSSSFLGCRWWLWVILALFGGERGQAQAARQCRVTLAGPRQRSGKNQTSRW